MCCTKHVCLHRGHSGFSLHQSQMQVQQKMCPHVVALGSFIGSRHSVHLRACRPSSQPNMCLSARSTRGSAAIGVLIICASLS